MARGRVSHLAHVCQGLMVAPTHTSRLHRWQVGHNGGLNHDGTSTTGYYTGHGSGVTGWAPIMGVGYYQNLVQVRSLCQWEGGRGVSTYPVLPTHPCCQCL
jgi:hypothetical protein